MKGKQHIILRFDSGAEYVHAVALVSAIEYSGDSTPFTGTELSQLKNDNL